MKLKTSDQPLPQGAVYREVERHRGGVVMTVRDAVAEEVPVALVYNDRPHAVMMATPADLEDFAVGFSWSEAIVDTPEQCREIRIVEALAGIELHVRIPHDKAALLEDKVRQLTGRTGCGLCGAQTLDAAIRHPAQVGETAPVELASLKRALAELQQRQSINAVTGATHAAAWATADGAIALLREDVGRHNALDKLIGAMHFAGIDARAGFAVVTSRASYEMVMKAATVGIGFLAAISAPTALAIALAKETNLTLVGFARGESHSVYANAQRIRTAGFSPPAPLPEITPPDRSIAL